MARTRTPATATTVTTTKTTAAKTPAPKRPARATPTTTMSAGPTKKSTIIVTDEERYRMIAEAAYLRAEQRGFANGDPQADWLAAEREVDAMIATWQRNGRRQSARD